MEKTTKNILIFFLVVLIFYLMMTLEVILLPLALALLCALLFHPVVVLLRKMHLPKFFILPAVAVITLAILFGLFNLFVATIDEVTAEKVYFADKINLRLQQGLDIWRQITGTKVTQGHLFKTIKDDWLGGGFTTENMGNIASIITSFAGSFVMFAIYYILLLFGLTNYREYFEYVGKDTGQGKLLASFEKIQKSIFSYLGLKTLINIFVGLIVAGICHLFGLKFAIIIGFFTFVFHYIPNFGALFSVIIPVLLAIIQFDSFETVALLTASISGSQFIVGNFIEPKLLGSRLRLNTLTVVFGLVFWGWIWGIPGMMLSIPLTVLIKLILEQFPDLSIVARVMEKAPKRKKSEKKNEKDIIDTEQLDAQENSL